MTLQLTYHAVERFIGRYRQDASYDQARAELQALVAEAAPTRRHTLPGDAQLYVTLSEAGERIGLAVRDGVVVSVLPDGVEGQGLDLTPDEEQVEESRAMVAQCRAMVNADQHDKTLRQSDTQEARRRSAEELIRAWRWGGQQVTPKALKRAHAVLGLPFADPNASPWQVTRAYRVARTLPDGSVEIRGYADTFIEAEALKQKPDEGKKD